MLFKIRSMFKFNLNAIWTKSTNKCTRLLIMLMKLDIEKNILLQQCRRWYTKSHIAPKKHINISKRVLVYSGIKSLRFLGCALFFFFKFERPPICRAPTHLNLNVVRILKKGRINGPSVMHKQCKQVNNYTYHLRISFHDPE